jgi:ATP-dependent helicase HrpA
MSSPPAALTIDDVAASLDDLSIADAARLRRRLDGVRKLRDPKRRAGSLSKIQQDAAGARLRVLERAAAVPVVSYPPDLPVSRARDELAEAIEKHQVVIVAGETGSGKTTQLPKICLELGRGVRGLIGHTQPRRIAARTVAERIAEELGTELGGAVGYTVRFTDEVGPTTLVKLMTDGILLAEIQRDRMLTRYDTIIVDEAHERSLNIDFILGYLKQLLPRRPDLKVIVTGRGPLPAP